MDKYLSELDDTTVSMRDIVSAADKAFKDYFKRAESLCKNRTGLVKEICKDRIKGRAYKIKSDRLSYSIGKCKYAKKQSLCEKKIKSMVKELQFNIKKLNKRIRARQQKLR